MSVWLLIGAMTAVAVLLPLRALMRERRADDRRARELALYRRQLAELEEERAAGLIDTGEADAARLEVERRILRADRAEGEGQGRVPDGPARPLAVATLTAAVLAAVILYLMLGRPGLPGLPRGEQAGAVSAAGGETANAPDGQASMAALVDRLRASMEEAPERLEGWKLLGRSALNTGRPKLAADAFARALELAPEESELHAALGESLVAMAAGQVTPAAELAFRRAQARAPGDPAAGYYLGLAALQAGNPEQALERWRALLDAAPENAPWRASIRQQIARVEQSLAPGQRDAAPELSPEAVANAQDMTPAERQVMIESMVERLAARLEDNPEDYEGWLRLARARLVLGETDAAQEALAKAQSAAPAELKDEIAAERDRLSER